MRSAGRWVRDRAANVASGWCSWYYYWQGVTEEAVLANLEELRRRRDELPIEYVQIDDGYQAEIGDWLTPTRSSRTGWSGWSSRSTRRGFKAGLWLAPFLMGEKSQLWREHPDWAVQYKPGKPHIAMQNWGQDCYALDLTRPEVIEWLKTCLPNGVRRVGLRLRQDRLHLRRRGRWHSRRPESDASTSIPARTRGDPRGRRRAVHPRLRESDGAERRACGRSADRPGRRAVLASSRRRRAIRSATG